MGLLLRSVGMLSLLIWSSASLFVRAKSDRFSGFSAHSLDVLLQDYAYRAFVHPKTGVAYEGNAPSNLTGIKIAAMRLRSGSLRKRGVRSYNEFEIPIGVKEKPYVERLVLVYQNLGNWSEVYYPLSGYTYLVPVLGLLAYSAANLSATNLPELDIRASMDPISIHFSNVKSVPVGSIAKCVSFDLQGVTNFSNVEPANTCSAVQQGHFALVVEGTAPPPVGAAPPSLVPTPGVEKKGHKSKVSTIVGSVLGGSLLLVLLALLLLWLSNYKRTMRIRRLERAAEGGEALRMTSVGSARAPAAVRTRTQPSLETEYVP
ncbi:hypothetical protein Nepgr_028234 [Nepenthes gracilis]|uniref:Transmembrane protein n=1 Tax=Nepenthes gracilis TaxID=150966 RepID=A0AAD3TCR0_NEPGR|nr:hypothetical protein Nepgr_028234 [Nepenthes gracilis]